MTPAADGFIHFNDDGDGNGDYDGGDGGADYDGNGNGNAAHPPYARLVPLSEIISAVRGVGVNTRTVQREYAAVTNALHSELNALLHATPSDLAAAVADDLAAAILRARAGQIDITPGYDGQYGAVRIPIPPA